MDILGPSCGVVKHGSPLEIALTRSLLNVLPSRGSARSLRALLVKILRNLTLRSRISLGHRQKKTLLQPDAEVDNVLGVTRNLCFLIALSLMNKAIPWKTKMIQEEGFMSIGRSIFQARVEGPRHHQHEDILRFVQKAPDDVRWTIDRTEFDGLLALKKDSAPGPDGIPHGAYMCAGSLGSHFLFNASKFLSAGGTVPEHFAEK